MDGYDSLMTLLLMTSGLLGQKSLPLILRYAEMPKFQHVVNAGPTMALPTFFWSFGPHNCTSPDDELSTLQPMKPWIGQ
jgi:hypothetical protein